MNKPELLAGWCLDGTDSVMAGHDKVVHDVSEANRSELGAEGMGPASIGEVAIQAPVKPGANRRIQPTDEAIDEVGVYLNQIGAIPLLTKELEVDLAQQIEAGNAAKRQLQADAQGAVVGPEREKLEAVIQDGEAATKQFTEANLRLVVSVAKRFQGKGLDLLDLIQEGNLGLMHAVDKFDWRKGFKFSTYATWWIKQAISRGIANSGRTIRLPIGVHAEVGRIPISRTHLTNVLNREPTLAELAEYLGVSEQQVIANSRLLGGITSLDEPPDELRPDFTLANVVTDNSSEFEFNDIDTAGSMVQSVNDLFKLCSLDEVESQVLGLKFGLEDGVERTYQELAEELGLPVSAVSRITRRAFRKTKEHIQGRGLALGEWLD